MSDKEWFKLALAVGLVITIAFVSPDIIKYVIVKKALDGFNETAEKSLYESRERHLTYVKDQNKRKSLLAQAKIKKEADALYSNAACVLNEDSGKCVCIDKRTNKLISIGMPACKRRASQYNH